MTEKWEHFARYSLQVLFELSEEASDAKAEVLMEEAIEIMDDFADQLTDRDEPPIPTVERKEVMMKMFEQTFERLLNARRIRRWPISE